MDKCQQKIMYLTRSNAKRAARVVKACGKERRNGINNKRLRPYQCRTCGFWHLTSQVNVHNQYGKDVSTCQ